jgi:hypothetical protein
MGNSGNQRARHNAAVMLWATIVALGLESSEQIFSVYWRYSLGFTLMTGIIERKKEEDFHG